MALDNEIRLINVAWKGTGDGWHELVAAKITPDMFFNTDVRDIYQFALDIHDKHGSYPSEAFTKSNFPNFTRVKITDSIDILIDAFKAWRREQVVRQRITAAIDAIEDRDIDAALAEMEGGVLQVAAEAMTGDGDIDVNDKPLDRLAEYQAFSQRPAGLLGVTTGFPTIDDVTSGLQPGQLIVVVAEPKVGKSTLAMQMGISANEAGADVMFQTIEMSKDEMVQRYDAMRAGISYSRFRTGTLKTSEVKAYERMLQDTAQMTARFVITDSVTDLPQVSAKIEELKPAVVIVDGVYLLNSHPDFPPGSAQALTYLSRAMKRLAKSTDTAIILTTQALHSKLSGGKLTAHSIGYSSSFFQDADLVLGLEKDSDETEDTRILRILAARNSGGAEVDLDWDWSEGLFAEVAP